MWASSQKLCSVCIDEMGAGNELVCSKRADRDSLGQLAKGSVIGLETT